MCLLLGNGAGVKRSVSFLDEGWFAVGDGVFGYGHLMLLKNLLWLESGTKLFTACDAGIILSHVLIHGIQICGAVWLHGEYLS